MDLGMTVEILTQLGLGALVAFLAILLWSYTRDSAWMLVIIGIILKFGEVMYTTFELFGIVRPGLLVIKGVAVGKVVLLALPYIAFAAAFLVMILRSRVRIRTLSSSAERRKEPAEVPPPPEPTAALEGGGEPAGGAADRAIREEEEAGNAAAERAAKAEALEEAEPAEEIEEIEEVEEVEEAEEIEPLEEVEDEETS